VKRRERGKREEGGLKRGEHHQTADVGRNLREERAEGGLGRTESHH